jgi:hypothetical protein
MSYFHKSALYKQGNAPIRFEKERQLVAIKLVFGIDHVHRQQALANFALAHFEYFMFFLALWLVQQHESECVVLKNDPTRGVPVR